MAAGFAVLVVSGWLAAVIFLSVGSRREVLALARPVQQFDELTESDFRVVRVAADSDVDLVSSSELDELTGSVAATDLAEGSLLHEDELLAADERLVGSDEATIGAVLGSAAFPANLAPGAEVQIVIRPASGAATDDGTETVSSWVLAVDDAEDSPTGGKRVTLVVPASSAAVVSAAAAEERVSLAVVGEGR